MRHCSHAVIGILVAFLVTCGLLVAEEQVPAPRKIKDAPPVYPVESLQAGDEGVFLVELNISAAGAVERAQVLASGCKRLEPAALAAVRQWQYAPLRVNGNPTPFRMVVKVPFRLPPQFKERAGRAGACQWKEPKQIRNEGRETQTQ